MSKALFPTVSWSQRKDHIDLVVAVADPEDLQVDLDSEALKFSAKSGGQLYQFELKFYEAIDKENSKWAATREVHFFLVKSEKKRWPRLTADSTKLHWLKVNWGQWMDTDAEEEAESGMGGMGGPGDMDFARMMGGMGGMGGMDGMDFSKFGGMPGMDDMEGLSDEDDEDVDGEPATKIPGLDDEDEVPTGEKVAAAETAAEATTAN